MDEKLERYTPFLLNILQQEGTLPNFLDVIFAFLRTRTDFYHILTPENQKTGFPPGVAKKIVLEQFKRHEEIAKQYLGNKSTPTTTLSNQPSKPLPKPAATAANPSVTEANPPRSVSQLSPAASSQLSPPAPINEGDHEEKVYMSNPDQYNGATFENYSWSQSINDLDVRVTIPTHVKSSKQLRVLVGRSNLNVSVVGHCPTELISGDLKWEVRHSDVVWAFHPADHQLHISLDKVEERWWDALLVGEQPLNTRAIDCSRPFEELDEESQAKIRELMFDQEQKRLGKPGVQQKKMEDMLKKAMQAEGCPFREQDLDPSQMQFDEATGSFTFPPPST